MSKEIERQLREAIIKSKISLYELMQKSGVDSGTLSRFVKGERTLTLPVASKIARVLNLELREAEGD